MLANWKSKFVAPA